VSHKTVGIRYLLTARVNSPKEKLHQNGKYNNPTSVTTNYDLFGMQMPGRSYNPTDYRFGMNGQEKDDEIAGSGNNYDFGERHYDPRLGRWMSCDRFAGKYAAWSPYSAMMDNPLAYIDIQGDSVQLIIGRPYSKNGVDHPYGHVALRVFNAAEGYDKVYDFGRYGEVSWTGKTGDGILNVYNSSKAYLKSEQTMRNSVGYTKPTTTEEDKAIMGGFDKLAKEGTVYNGGAVPGGGGTAYKLKEDYDVFSNNCCTKSTAGMKTIGLDWLGDEYDPRDAYTTMESQYRTLNLTRTQYNQGGSVNVTFKAMDLPKLNFAPTTPFIFNIPATPADATRVAPSKSVPMFK